MNEEVKEVLDSLTDEQKEKLKDCKNAEELKKIAEDASDRETSTQWHASY